MKVLFFILCLFAWSPAFAETKANSSNGPSCVDDSGNPKVGNHCICYMKKTVCSDGVSTCAEHVCEEVSCKTDKDCAAVSGNCADGFCKK